MPVAYNDYLHTQRFPIKAPLAANVGWITVKPGQPYTFSVAMKAAAADTPARLVVRQFRAAPVEKWCRLTTEWQRYSLEFTPQAAACYVLAGPDLRPTEDNPQPPDRATVWLDACNLPRRRRSGAFATRQPVELGIRPTSRATSCLGRAACGSHDSGFRPIQEERKAEIDLRLTDFFDEEVWHDAVGDCAGSSSEEMTVMVPAVVPAARLSCGCTRR